MHKYAHLSLFSYLCLELGSTCNTAKEDASPNLGPNASGTLGCWRAVLHSVRPPSSVWPSVRHWWRVLRVLCVYSVPSVHTACVLLRVNWHARSDTYVPLAVVPLIAWLCP